MRESRRVIVASKKGRHFTQGRGRTNSIVIRSEKRENHKNSTHTKIKFYIIFINLFSVIDIIKTQWRDAIFWGWGSGALARHRTKNRNRQLYVSKKKMTVPMLKLYFKSFLFNCIFFQGCIFKILTIGGGVRGGMGRGNSV